MAKGEYKFHWGVGVRPKLPFTTSSKGIFQGWRNNLIMSEMLALRCFRCHRIFYIMRDELQKELICPRGCGPVKYVRHKEQLLQKWLKKIISNGRAPENVGGGD